MVARTVTAVRLEIDWQDAGIVEGPWLDADPLLYPPQDVTSRARASVPTGVQKVRTVRDKSLKSSKLVSGQIRLDNEDGAFSLSGVDLYDLALRQPHLGRLSVGSATGPGRPAGVPGGAGRPGRRTRNVRCAVRSRAWDRNPPIEQAVAVNDGPADYASDRADRGVRRSGTGDCRSPKMSTRRLCATWLLQPSHSRCSPIWTTPRMWRWAGGGNGGTVASICRRSPNWTTPHMRPSMMGGQPKRTAPERGR